MSLFDTKVALVTGYPNGAIHQVMRALQVGLKAHDVESDLINVYDAQERNRLIHYDLVHLGYFGYEPHVQEALSNVPWTANVWHIPLMTNENGQAMFDDAYSNSFRQYTSSRFFVSEPMTLQQLGQLGRTDVTYAPIIFDATLFKVLPPPEGAFTVGVFANDYPSKRLHIIEQGCKAADVKYLPVVTPQNRKSYTLNPLTDVYAKIHVLAHASFVDTDSLPVREALLCGRPVITTRNCGMHDIINGNNGMFFDGSAADFAAKVSYVRACYREMSAAAPRTPMADPTIVATTYLDIWKGLL